MEERRQVPVRVGIRCGVETEDVLRERDRWIYANGHGYDNGKC